MKVATKVLQDRSRHVAFTTSFQSLCPTEVKYIK